MANVLKLVLEENGEVKDLALDQDQVTIGRTADNAVRISDALSSRHHCQIKRQADGFVVIDLKSRNGTKLNGVALATEHRLVPGDRIEVGDSIIHFSERKEAQAAAPKVKKKKPAPDALVQSDEAGEATLVADAPAVGAEAGAQLSFEAGEGQGRTVPIAPLPFVIGRKKTCALALEDADVSSEHCMIVEDGGVLLVVDLGATNKTLLDGEPVKGRAPLRRGAVLGIGPTLRLRVLIPTPGDEAKAPAKKPKAEKDAPRSDRADRSGRGAPSAALGAGPARGETKNDEGRGPGAPRPEEAKAIPKSDRAEKAIPKSDRVEKAIPKSDRVEKADKGPPKSDRHDRPGKKKEKPVEEVESLDALGGDTDAAAPAAVARQATRVLEAEAEDVAPTDFTERLEAKASAGDLGGGGGGAGALVGVGLVVLLLIGSAGAMLLSGVRRGGVDGDPRPTDALVDNWSFEESRPGAAGIQGWELFADRAAIVEDDVRHGRRALALTVAQGAMPEFRSSAPGVRISAGTAYRVRAAVACDPGTGAALRVDWASESDASLGASWAIVLDPSNDGASWRDVSGTVVAPRGATLARVVGVALAGEDGPARRVRFDRVHLAQESSAPPRQTIEGPGKLSLGVDARGVVSLQREARDLCSQLQLVVDPRSSLREQAAARLDQPLGLQPDESLLALGAIPGEPQRVEYAFSARSDQDGLHLRWGLGERTSAVQLAFSLPRLEDVQPIELDGQPLALGAIPPEGLVVAEVQEMAWLKGAAQVSFRLSAPAKLVLTKQGAGARLLFELPPRPLATGDGGVGIDLGAASTGTRDAIRRLFAAADAARAAGKDGEAIEAYRQLQAQFPHEADVVRRAKEGIEVLGRRADRLAEVARWAQEDARDLPLPQIVAAADDAVSELESAFAGSSQLAKARRDAQTAQETVSEAARRAQATRVRELLDRGQRLREAGHLHLTRLVWGAIVSGFDDKVPGVSDAKQRLAALPAEGAR